MSPPNVIGLDLSITATGWADDEGTCTIGGPASQGDRRLRLIYAAIASGAGNEGQAIDLAVIEDLPTHAHGSGITGMVHGVARLACMKFAIPYALVPPAVLKKYATGKGNATKPDMRMALYQRIGLDIRDDNQVDAWWLRAMGLDRLGYPIIELPKAQRESAGKAKWPVSG